MVVTVTDITQTDCKSCVQVTVPLDYNMQVLTRLRKRKELRMVVADSNYVANVVVTQVNPQPLIHLVAEAHPDWSVALHLASSLLGNP